MYIFSFTNVYDEQTQNVLDKYTKWLTHEELHDDEEIIELYYNFDDAGASELHNELGDSEIFGGYWAIS